MDIQKRFKELRLRKEISVYKLSKITDISENYIHCIEKGESTPSIDILERLLPILGTNLCDFLNEDRDICYLNESERELIQILRLLSAKQFDAILQVAKVMQEQKT